MFTYETPGLKYGIYATIIGIVLLGVYVLIIYAVLRRRPKPYVHLYDRDQHDGVAAHRSYMRQISEQISSSSEFGGRPPEQSVMMNMSELKKQLSEEDRKEFPIEIKNDGEEK